MMKRILSLSTFICVLSSLVFAKEWKEETLGEFRKGTLTNLTFSEPPGTKYISDQKASLKLSSKAPKIWQNTWNPPKGEASGKGSFKFQDANNDRDYDLFFSKTPFFWKGQQILG